MDVGSPTIVGRTNPRMVVLGAIRKLTEQVMERKPMSSTLPWLLQLSLLLQKETRHLSLKLDSLEYSSNKGR